MRKLIEVFGTDNYRKEEEVCCTLAEILDLKYFWL